MKRFFTGILLLFFFTPHLFSQAVKDLGNDYSVREISFSEEMAIKQVEGIKVDRNGFYWINMSPDQIIKWNGKIFEKVTRKYDGNVLESAVRRCIADYKGTIYFQPELVRKDILTVDEKSRIRDIDVRYKNGNFGWSINGTACLLNEQWKEIQFKNDPDLFVRFKEMYQDYFFTEKFQTLSGEIYLYGLLGALYYNKGRIVDLKKLPGTKSSSSVLVDSYWVVLTGNSYWMYESGRLIASGTHSGPKILTRNRVLENVWGVQCMATGTYLATEDIIYKISCNKGILNFKPFFRLPDGKAQFHSFFWDEQNDKLFLYKTSGGFLLYEKRLLKSQSSKASDGQQIVYSLSKATYGKAVTNHTLLAGIKGQTNFLYKYDDMGSVIPLKNTGYLYGANRELFVMTNEARVRKKFPIDYGNLRSWVQTDSCVYFTTFGIHSYDYRSDSVRKIELLYKGKPLPVSFLVAAGEGGFFAISDKQVFFIDSQFKKVSLLVDKEFHFPRILVFDRKLNVLFITSVGEGLFICKPDSRQLIHFPVDDKGILRYVHYVLMDNEGDYWLPTNNGLFLILANEMRAFLAGKISLPRMNRFGKESGLINEEFNGGFKNCAVAAGDSVYFASMGGVVAGSIRTMKMKVSETSFPFTLENIFLNDSLMQVHKTVTFPPDYRNIRFRFNYPYIQEPSASFRYRIGNSSDSAWYALPETGDLLIQYLSPGTFFLEIQKKGTKADIYFKQEFTIRQFWYLRWWALLAYAIIITSVILFLINWRVQQQKNKALKEVNRLRKQILAVIGHDLRGPLQAYSQLASSFRYLVERGQWDRIEKISEQLEAKGHHLQVLVQNLLDWGYSLDKGTKLDIASYDVNALVSEVLPVYEQMAQTKNQRFVKTLPAAVKLDTDKYLFTAIIRNLLDNAAKYSLADTDITVETGADERSVFFRISNETILLDTEKLEAIRSLFRNEKEWEPGESDLGLGMITIAQSAKRLGAHVTVNQKEQKFEISVNFPTPNL